MVVEPDVEAKVAMCLDCIEWSKESNRRFLKQALEIVLTGLHYAARHYQDSLAVAQPLIRELKRFDDKLQLVEVQLIESKAYYACVATTIPPCCRTVMSQRVVVSLIQPALIIMCTALLQAIELSTIPCVASVCADNCQCDLLPTEDASQFRHHVRHSACPGEGL